jgi:hypothetical protein
VTLLRGLASRAKALLLTEADEVFETMDRRKRRRFRQHPLRVHLLYLLGYATGAAAVWYAAGARVALVIWGLPLLGLLLAVVNGAIRRWRRDPSSAQQLPPGARPAEPSSSDERAREGAADTRPERSWGISLLLALPALALVGFATLLVAAGVATIHDEGWGRQRPLPRRGTPVVPRLAANPISIPHQARECSARPRAPEVLDPLRAVHDRVHVPGHPNCDRKRRDRDHCRLRCSHRDRVRGCWRRAIAQAQEPDQGRTEAELTATPSALLLGSLGVPECHRSVRAWRRCSRLQNRGSVSNRVRATGGRACSKSDTTGTAKQRKNSGSDSCSLRPRVRGALCAGIQLIRV